MKPHKHTKVPSRLRVILYSLVAILFAGTLAIVLVLANGYQPSFRNGKFALEKTGMLIVSSRPSGAELSIDNKLKLTTSLYFLPSHVSGLVQGQYDVTLTKAGFRTWKNRVQIDPGLVTWANYALLFPNKLDIRKISNLGSGYISKSENGHAMLFYGKRGDTTTVTSYDSGNLAEKLFWPNNVSGEAEYIKNPIILAGKIDNANQHALLTLKNGDSEALVLLDASGNEPKLTNLTEQLKSTATDIAFDRFDSNYLYLKLNSNLYRYNIANKSLGDSLVDNIVSYNVEDNQQIYYANNIAVGNTNKISRMNLDGSGKTMIVDASISQKGYSFSHTNYNDTLAYLNHDTGDLTMISPTTGENTISMKLATGVLGMDFGKDGHKLYYYKQKSLSRYDLEKKKTISFSTSSNIVSVNWYLEDAHYLLQTTTGLSIVDYDGANEVQISSKPVVNLVDDDRDNNNIFSVMTDGKTTFEHFISPF